MRKIPTLFVRDPATKLRHVTREVAPGCEWVADGEGVATYKWDGTAVRIDESGVMWKRREVKPGKPVPEGFEPEGDADPETGKRVGWVLCQPEDKWHFEGLGHLISSRPDDKPWPMGDVAGTYELVGPKVQGNPHALAEHVLMRHGERVLGALFDDRSYGELVEAFQIVVSAARPADKGFEGVVWHHPDGRMAKLKWRDLRELN